MRRVASCCVDCWSVLPRLGAGRCGRCALPLSGSTGVESACIRCLTEPLSVEWIDSWGRYDSGLTKVLHALKFRGQAFLADPLGDLLAAVLSGRGTSPPDIIVPVPMTRAKERSRGYNQAELLARSLSKRTGVPLETGLLRKTEDRRTQSELRKEDRGANVKGTFAAGAAAGGRSVLLVDDICTTGETLSACAEALLGSGAKSVCAVTVARTP